MICSWQERFRVALGTSPSAANPYPVVRLVDELVDCMKESSNRALAPALYDMLRGHGGYDDSILAHIERAGGPVERSHSAHAFDAAGIGIRPLRDVVYIKAEAPEERRGRIWLPQCVQQRAHCGTVAASGPGYEMLTGQVVPAFFEVGDRVVFQPHSATLVKLDGVDYWRTVHSSVVAVVTPEAKVEA